MKARITIPAEWLGDIVDSLTADLAGLDADIWHMQEQEGYYLHDYTRATLTNARKELEQRLSYLREQWFKTTTAGT